MSYRPIKIYLSSSWDDRDEVQEFVGRLDTYHEGKYLVTCSWWDQFGDDSLTYALQDKIAVEDCDIFILYNGDKKSSGKLIEYGMAIALGKTIKIYGKKLTTVFRHLAEYCDEKLPENFFDAK